MTKAGVVTEIAKQTGVEKQEVMVILESFMKTVKDTMVEGDNVYLRGFGTFVLKKRAEKFGRNITKGTQVHIPEHFIASFKAAKPFAVKVKNATKKEKKKYNNDWRNKNKE